MITDRNLASEYASMFHLDAQYVNESGAEFRERVARELYKLGHRVYAHEALNNERMSSDPFAHGSLDRGYGDAFITQTARTIEAVYVASQPKPKGNKPWWWPF